MLDYTNKGRNSYVEYFLIIIASKVLEIIDILEFGIYLIILCLSRSL
jgi:hypothetical protein